MKTIGRVLLLFVTEAAGCPMRSVDWVEIQAKRGIKGDRYAEGNGTYSGGKPRKPKIRHVSLISVEGIEAANEIVEIPFESSDTRRNIITEGVDLNALVGREFRVGGVRMRGTELCDPCTWPSRCSSKPDFKEAFENRGGLRAEALSTGLIFVRDRIFVP